MAFTQGNALPADATTPLVLSDMAESGARITAANGAAEALGLFAGMATTDARAMHPPLVVEAADAAGDRQALRRLAFWCQRYSPLVRMEAPDGLCLDIDGCAHLFGGEERLAEDLAGRLAGFGLTARLAVAPTIGAGWALARFGSEEIAHVARGETGARLAPLPVAGLRLAEGTVAGLKRLGLERIGLLIGKPRAPLVTRFGPLPVLRLDQALGSEDESFGPLCAPPFYQAACRFAEPIVTLDAVETTIGRLSGELTRVLDHAGKAARRFELALYRVDGWRETLAIRTSSLSRDADHLARLLGERLDRIRDHAGFGFETATLAAFDVEDADAVQHGLAMPGEDTQEGDIAPLIDRLANRFGPRNVVRFAPRASYVPERGFERVSMLDARPDRDWLAHMRARQNDAAFARPVLLFDTPEPVDVVVEMPDKPPARFQWRRVSHRITRAEGPERIAPEWWLRGNVSRQTRDYYRVEDETGRRFWLYRDGLYERTNDQPRWFIHGMFS